MDLRLRIDSGAKDFAVASHAPRNVFLGDGQHAAGAAARVVNTAHNAGSGDAVFLTGEHEIHHQVDHVPRREVLPGILIQGFVESADQLFKDRPHGRVVDPIRMQVDVLEPLQHLEQQPRFVELADRVVEVESFQHLAHVIAETGDAVSQVGGKLGRIGQQRVEVIA